MQQQVAGVPQQRQNFQYLQLPSNRFVTVKQGPPQGQQFHQRTILVPQPNRPGMTQRIQVVQQGGHRQLLARSPSPSLVRPAGVIQPQMRGPNGQVVRVVPAGPGPGASRVVPIQLRPEGPARVYAGQPGAIRMQVHQRPMHQLVPRPSGSPSRQGVIQQVGGFQQGQRFPTSFGPGVPGANQWRTQQPRMMRPEQPPMRQFGPGPEMGQAPGQSMVRPAGPPQPGPEGQGEIAYNVEHVFIENGKEVRKMPISHEGQTIWVECVQNQHSAGQGPNTQQPREGGIMLDIDCADLEIPGGRPPGQVNQKPTGKPPTSPYTTSSKRYDPDFQAKVVAAYAEEPYVKLADLANRFSVSSSTVREWSKKAGVNRTSNHGSPKVGGMVPIGVVTSNINSLPDHLPQLPTAPVPPGQLEGVRPQVTTAGPPTPDSCQPGEASPSPASTPTSSIPTSTSATIVANQPKLIPGKLAMCKWCGDLSPDFAKCIRCKRKLPEDCKAVDDPALKPKPDSTGHNDMAKKAALRGVRIPNKSRRKGAASDEPVCIALSSDEEEDENSNMSSGQQSSSEINLEGPTGDGVPSLAADENIFDGSAPGNWCNLACRSVRVGSYKVLPKDRISITEKGVQIKVPAIMNNMEIVTITIPMNDVLKVLAHFGKSMPLLFLYISPGACKRARASLAMNSVQSFYIDITSQDETQKRITILPEKLTDDNKMILKRFFASSLQEVESKEANEILVRSSPKDLHILKQKMASANGLVPKKNEEEASVVKYCQFPPEGTGTVSVTTEDYLCLEDEQFLNDVIIDFYMRYLQFGKESSAHKQFTSPHFTTPLSEIDRDRVHIFSTYFYKRLTTRPKQVKNKLHPIEDNPDLSAAEKRYERVKKWTKKVNLFEKDFIVVPINEHAHWFVCVICFPGKVGCTRFDDDRPCSPPPSQANRRIKKKKRERKPLQIGSTTIIPLKSGDRDVRLQLEEEFSDRDEADASDDDMEDEADDDSGNSQKDKNSSNENSKNGMESDETKTEGGDKSDKNGDSKDPKSRVSIKQPCILVFDSLAGGSKAKVCATLRDYLTCEYRAKNDTERTYTKTSMPANAPKVQQQPNFSDCGIYVLQYIEMFFRIPIKDYALPVVTLKSWFDELEVRNKRESIAKLIRNLAEEQHPGKNIDYPEITFTAPDDDDDDDDDLDDTFDDDVSPTNNKTVNYVQVSSSGGSTPQMIRLTSGTALKASPRLVSTQQGKVTLQGSATKGPQMLLCKTGDKLKLSPMPGVMGVPPGVTVTPARRTGVKITPTNTITVAQPQRSLLGTSNLGPGIHVRKLSSAPSGFSVSQPVASSSNSNSASETVLQTSPDSTSNGHDGGPSPHVEGADNDDANAEYPGSDNENSDTFVPDSQGLESEDSNSSVKRRAPDQEDPLGGKRIKPDS